MARLTESMLVDLIKITGVTRVKACIALPVVGLSTLL